MKKSSEPWKPPAWLEPAFIYIAFSVAVVATAVLLLWIVITFIVPFNIYSRETELISLNNGQTLQVEYPNLVLAGDTPAYITLILYGESNATSPADFTVGIPSGLTVVEPVDQAQGKIVKLTAADLGSATEPGQLKIGVVNLRSVGGLLLFVRQPMIIESSFMPDKQNIEIGIEKISWMSARGIVNNTINEKSTLILLVTGFLSGAGTLVLQYTKTHRDRVRDDRQKKEDEFRNRLKEDFLVAINLFLSLDKVTQAEDWDMYERLVRPSGWEYKIPALVFDRLENKKNDDAKQVAETLLKLCEIFGAKVAPDQNDELKHLKSLHGVCDLTLIEYPQKKKLTKEEISRLLITYKRWQELKPLITSLIHEFAWLAENLSIIDGALVPDKDGLFLLRDSSIEKIIENHIDATEDDTEENKAAKNIHSRLTLDVKWRPLWSGKERKFSYKTLRWLSGHWYENSIDDDFSLGSEYAELDSKLSDLAIQHPVFEQVNGAFPAIVFGDEGMGKTASALQLVKKYQDLAKSDSKESKVFPVYAPFESGVDVKEWFVEKISRALIDFTADNPRRFLTAPDSQKTAMGRLMLRHTQNVDALRLNFYSSPFNNNATDIEQALEYILKLKYVMPPAKLTKEETLNLLYMARPDIFDQIYFLWDIRSATLQEEAISKVREIEGLALPMARQNLFIKIFAPLTIKKSLGNLPGFRSVNYDLMWSESQLKELIETRVKMFTALWERGIDDPVGLIISAIDHSPRHVVRFLIRLMDYVDEHLQEGEKLNKNILEQVQISLVEKK